MNHFGKFRTKLKVLAIVILFVGNLQLCVKKL